MAGLKKRVVAEPGDLSTDSSSWPDWVLTPQVVGETFGERLGAFQAWQVERRRWVQANTKLWRPFRGRVSITPFLSVARQERRRRLAELD